MQANPAYQDVVTEVYDFLARRIDWAEASGIPRERIAVDPGIGFGKTARAQSRDLAEPRTICHAGVSDPGRSLAQGVSRFDHGQAGFRAHRGDRRRLARRLPSRCPDRPRSRRRRDGRRHPRLDGLEELGGSHMSPHSGNQAESESYALAETSPCRAMAEAAKAASRRLAVTRGEIRNAWLRKSRRLAPRAPRRSPRRQRPRHRPRPEPPVSPPPQSSA